MRAAKIGIAHRLMGVVALGAAGLAVMAVVALTNLYSGVLAERRSVARTQVETAVSAIKAGLSDLGDRDTPVVRTKVAKLIAALRYDGNNYFWVNDTNGVMVAHPMRPELNGTDVLGLRDANGTRMFVEFNAVAKEKGAGFVSYWWKNPGDNAAREKIAYVASIPQLGWVAGTGIYIDSVEASFRQTAVDMIAVGLVVLAVTCAAAFLITRGVTRPLALLTRRTRALAEGDLTMEVPFAERGDEIGSLARAVAVFKDSSLEARRLRTERDVQRERSEAEKRALLGGLADELESEVTRIAVVVDQAAGGLETSSGELSAAARSTETAVLSASTSSSRVADDTGAIAAAGEELSASIKEISRQVTRSREIADAAVDNTKTADAVMNRLTEEVGRIDEIVELINTIAKQTNLLALNATIESARAGEAGKGFAVVANEVKHLADQTAKATEEIRGEIRDIQLSTSNAASAIHEARGRIDEMSDITRSLVSAVEQQDEATREIARGIRSAADGSEEVGRGMVTLNRAAEASGKAADGVGEAARALVREAAGLRVGVEAFAKRIRET